MRRTGLDEYKVARTFAGVVDKLSDGNKDTGGVQKLLVDVLKECSRHLDPRNPSAPPQPPPRKSPWSTTSRAQFARNRRRSSN
jgi:hypothetical protein